MHSTHNKYYSNSYIMAIISGMTGNILSAILFIQVALANNSPEFLYKPQKAKTYSIACIIEIIFLAVLLLISLIQILQ